jgi:hypothetical protein
MSTDEKTTEERGWEIIDGQLRKQRPLAKGLDYFKGKIFSQRGADRRRRNDEYDAKIQEKRKNGGR